MRNKNFSVWMEGTIIAALAIVLSLIPTNIGPSFTVSLGMIPVTLYAFRRGFVPAVYAGFLWGILHFVIGNAYILSPLQGFIEYFIAFAFAGFGGLFAKKVQSLSEENRVHQLNLFIVLGTFTGTMARFFWHFVVKVLLLGKLRARRNGCFCLFFYHTNLKRCYYCCRCKYDFDSDSKNNAKTIYHKDSCINHKENRCKACFLLFLRAIDFYKRILHDG